jgi:hypothetical protein
MCSYLISIKDAKPTPYSIGILHSFVLLLSIFAMPISVLAAGNIKIAIDAEFGIPFSTSAQAVRNGERLHRLAGTQGWEGQA